MKSTLNHFLMSLNLISPNVTAGLSFVEPITNLGQLGHAELHLDVNSICK